MENIIEFSIPGLYQYTSLNMKLISLMEENPTKFYDDVRVDSMYGSFPCIFNGGRVIKGTFDIQDVISCVRILNKKGIKVKYTFTNMFINEDNVKDTIGNAILKTTGDYQLFNNDVIVASDIMDKYLRANYPDFNICYSTTLGLKTLEEINEFSEKGTVIPDYSVSKDFDLLSKLKNPHCIEILANESCKPNCKNRKKHYENNSLIQMYEDVDEIECDNDYDKNYEEVKRMPHHVSIDEIREKYIPLGINKFKICGRNTNPVSVIESYIEYLVKDEYKNEIRNELFMFLTDSLS